MITVTAISPSEVVIGSCATDAREPGQDRKVAAFIGIVCVPQIAWSSPHSARSLPFSGAVTACLQILRWFPGCWDVSAGFGECWTWHWLVRMVRP